MSVSFFIFIKVLETILKELRDPDRNMHNFDPGDILNKSPLKNLFLILKENERGNFLQLWTTMAMGLLTRMSLCRLVITILVGYLMHQGCLSDEAFVKLLEDFNGDVIWGSE